MIQETSLNFEDPIAPKCINQQYAERRKRRQKNKAHQYVAAMAIPGKHDDDINYYYERYTCKPNCDSRTGSFPFFILTTTIAQITIFATFYAEAGSFKDLCRFNYDMVKSDLIFNPHRREDVWRFITYQFLHAGFHHIFGNMLFQLVFGIPLEMVHGTMRVGAIYTMGVFMGSLFSSIVNVKTFLLGASGGDYCLIFAQLANCIMNWDDMTWFGWLVRLIPVVTYAWYDISQTLARFAAGETSTVSWSAHLGGAVAGLTFGICMLKNFRRMPWEGVLWKISCLLFISILTFAIFWNLFWPGYSVGDGLEDFRDVNMTEVLANAKGRTEELLDSMSD